MQNKNKTIAITIALLLTISMVSSMILMPNAYAHTPAYNIPTYAYIVAAPSPIGVGQTACLLYTSPSPRDGLLSRMPSSA